MSIYMYTLRKSKSHTLECAYFGVGLKFPVYQFKFAFANCNWDYDGTLKVSGSDKAKMTKARKAFGKKPVLVELWGDIYFQETASPFWFDVDPKPYGVLVGEMREFHIDTGEPIKPEPVILMHGEDYIHEGWRATAIRERKMIKTLIKEYYPNMKLEIS